MAEYTTEQLITAGEDLNKICTLEPPINVVFETKARGAVKANAMKKFAENLKEEIIQVATGQDAESKEYDLQEGDLALLQPETVAVIFEICPQAKQRLQPEAGGDAKKTEKKKREGGFKPSEKVAERRVFMAGLIAEAKYNKKEVVQKTKERFPDVSESSLVTMISDGKNPKYNKFDQPVKENDQKILSF